MSELRYGLANLTPVHTRQIGREVVRSRDGQDYVCTKWTFDVDCVYNPAYVSYRSGGGPPAIPLEVPGRDALVTDTSLRQHLATPRRVLRYLVGGRLLLTSPLPGMTCDVRGGPYTEVLSITQNLADKTFLVSIRIVTYTMECPPGSGGRLPVLLSHRWKRHASVDEHHQATVVTEGEAVFRLDELIRRGSFPDEYRRELFHPLPPNMVRTGVVVIPFEDGTGLWYQITDKESFVHWGPGAVTLVQASHAIEVNMPMITVGGLVSGAREGLATGRRYRQRIDAAGGTAGPVVQVATGFVHTAALIAASAMPLITVQATAECWGSRGIGRFRLQELAIGIVAARCGNARATDSGHFDVEHDITGKYVKTNLVYTGPFTAIGTWAGATARALELLGSKGEDTDTVTGVEPFDLHVKKGKLIQYSSATGWVHQPNANAAYHSRGSYAGLLMAQGLGTACALPMAPPGHTEGSGGLVGKILAVN